MPDLWQRIHPIASIVSKTVAWGYRVRRESDSMEGLLRILPPLPMGLVMDASFVEVNERVRFFQHPSFISLLEFDCYLDPIRGVPLYYFLESWHDPSETMHRLISDHNLFSIKEATQILSTCASAVADALDAGVGSWQLSPSSVLWEGSPGSPVRLAHPLSTRIFEKLRSLHVSSGYTVADHFTAPECEDGQAADMRSMVWTLGAMLFHSVSNRVPRTPGSPKTQPPPDLRILRADLSRDFAVVAAMALHPDPQMRYASVGDLADDLASLAAGQVPENAGAGASAKLQQTTLLRRSSSVQAANLESETDDVPIDGSLEALSVAPRNGGLSERQRQKNRRLTILLASLAAVLVVAIATTLIVVRRKTPKTEHGTKIPSTEHPRPEPVTSRTQQQKPVVKPPPEMVVTKVDTPKSPNEPIPVPPEIPVLPIQMNPPVSLPEKTEDEPRVPVIPTPPIPEQIQPSPVQTPQKPVPIAVKPEGSLCDLRLAVLDQEQPRLLVMSPTAGLAFAECAIMALPRATGKPVALEKTNTAWSLDGVRVTPLSVAVPGLASVEVQSTAESTLLLVWTVPTDGWYLIRQATVQSSSAGEPASLHFFINGHLVGRCVERLPSRPVWAIGNLKAKQEVLCHISALRPSRFGFSIERVTSVTEVVKCINVPSIPPSAVRSVSGKDQYEVRVPVQVYSCPKESWLDLFVDGNFAFERRIGESGGLLWKGTGNAIRSFRVRLQDGHGGSRWFDSQRLMIGKVPFRVLVVVRAAQSADAGYVQQAVKLLAAEKIAVSIQAVDKLDATILAQQEAIWFCGNFHETNPVPPEIMPFLKTCKATLIMDDPKLWLDLGLCRSLEDLGLNAVRNNVSKPFPTGTSTSTLAMECPIDRKLPFLVGQKQGIFMGSLSRGTTLNNGSKTPAIRMLVPQIGFWSGQGNVPEPTRLFIQQSVQDVLEKHYTDLPP